MEAMGLITFVTRCCKRPTMLSRNIESVQSQTSSDWEQLFLVDQQGHNDIPWANKQLDEHKEFIQGDWVFILDDDCVLVENDFVSTIQKATSLAPRAKLIMVRSVRPQLDPQLLPTNNLWGKDFSAFGNIGIRVNCLTYVVARDLWCAKITEFKGHSGARTFFEAVIQENPRVMWVDQVMSSTQQLGRGKRFEDCKPDWWKKIVGKYGLIRAGWTNVWKACGQ